MRVFEAEPGDMGVFAETMTEGMVGSFECDELEFESEASTALALTLAVSISLSWGFSFSFPLAELAFPFVPIALPLPFTFPNRPPPDVTPLNFHRTSNSPLTSGTLLS